MYTGIISLADRISFNIKSNDIKDYILDQIYSLYNIKIIQKHYFNLNENNYKFIKNNSHLCCLRSNGNPYYLFFTLYNDIPIMYYIDKKVHPNYLKPRIILARGLFDKSLFKNTLLDGEMIKTKNNKWIFVINDIISYENNHLIDKTLPERLKIIYNILENKYTSDKLIDVCEYKVKLYFNLYKKSISELIKVSYNLDYTSRGIYLWPMKLIYKPILYNFNDNDIIDVIRKVKDETKFKTLDYHNNNIINNENNIINNENNIINNENNIINNENNIINNENNIINNENNIINNENNKNEIDLWITKTDEPDVYNLYDNENIINQKKIGIAFVSLLYTSKMLRLAFKNKIASKTIKFRCKYIDTFKKWQPLFELNS